MPNNKTELEKRKERLLGPDKIVNDAMQANKQVQELRKSLQSLPRTDLQPSRRDDALRRSGTGTAGYQRPQGYVRKALSKAGSRTNISTGETPRGDSSAKRPPPTFGVPTPDKFVNRDSPRGRVPTFGQNSAVASAGRGQQRRENAV